MDPYGKNELLSFYTRHLVHFGDAPQALRWTPAGQERRYEALCDAAGDLAGKSVLDFGCGKGDLCGYLEARGMPVRYCGVDVNEKLIELARKKHPGREFLALDIEQAGLGRAFDVILVCGVFNLRIAGIEESMKNVLRKLFPLCREALHLNIPSARAARKDIELYYADPEQVLKFAMAELSPSVTLRHGTIRDEMFLSVYRN